MFRNICFYVYFFFVKRFRCHESALTMPAKPITGPNLDLEMKVFLVGVAVRFLVNLGSYYSNFSGPITLAGQFSNHSKNFQMQLFELFFLQNILYLLSSTNYMRTIFCLHVTGEL